MILSIKNNIVCPVCQHKFVWQSAELTVRNAMIYNAWLDMTVEHVRECEVAWEEVRRMEKEAETNVGVRYEEE